MINTMVFMVVATGLIGSMLGLYLLRTTQDYASVRQAEAKSAISQLAGAVVNELNTTFPADWLAAGPADLKAATQPLGAIPEMQATAYLTGFYQNPTTGLITANVIGQSTAAGQVTVTAALTISPTGAAIFQGVDAQQRPIWIYSGGAIDALALYEISPSSIQYLSPGGLPAD